MVGMPAHHARIASPRRPFIDVIARMHDQVEVFIGEMAVGGIEAGLVMLAADGDKAQAVAVLQHRLAIVAQIVAAVPVAPGVPSSMLRVAGAVPRTDRARVLSDPSTSTVSEPRTSEETVMLLIG